MGNMAPVFVLVSFAFCAGWIVWVLSNNWRRGKIAQTQKEMHTKLFEKFGTSQELLEYLKSEAGIRLVDSATIEHAKPFGRVLGSVQAGLILFLLGVAMWFVRGSLPQEAFSTAMDQAQAAESFLVISLLLLALGAGFLLSAAAAYWMSRSWGLFERESGHQR